MLARELKDKFVSFFVAKNHVEIPSASLVPDNDPTTLFISAGIQPIVPYFLGKKHPSGNRLVNVQKCVRTVDIDNVGDGFHHTFFEMLGNWSLGDYFKTEMIPWSYEFLTKHLGINPDHLSVTCFEGDADAPRDTETHDLWRSMGIPEDRIHYLPKEDNWWGPPGITGPCGTDSEMFVDTNPTAGPIDFKEGCQAGRIIEIGNDVLIQYFKNDRGEYEKLVQNNIDTGYGVERNIAWMNGFADNYLTTIWRPIIKKIEEISGIKYNKSPLSKGDLGGLVSFRIIADHIRSAVFIIADGIEPSNKEAGYVLRRLIRRAIRQGKLLGIETSFIRLVAESVLDNQDNYAGIYPELNQNRDKILSTLELEETKFRKTLNNGLREIQKLIEKISVETHHDASLPCVSGKTAFTLYESFGFPVEMIKEELEKNKLTLNLQDFEQAKLTHSQQSKTLSAGKFKSGLVDHSEITTKYHTATHLLHAALRQVLGVHVQQSGSNITAERLRFDFSHPQKVTPEELKQVENIVNQKITEKLPISVETMKFTEAQTAGALAFFGTKYPEVVTVYSIGDYSKEVCTGPHVKNTSELGKFKIIKEEASGSGKRRIYAV
jgi:alanyl-tRNA synthetase